MPSFLTVREAAEFTGKSPSSIRRAIYPILRDDLHADLQHIQPTVEEAVELRMKGEGFAWRVSEDLLRRVVPVEAGPERNSPASSFKTPAGHAEGELLLIRRRELEIKNQQITQASELISKQMELVSGLSERLREGNILIGGLQQRLALTDGRDTKPSEPTKAKTVHSTPTKPEKGTATLTKAAKPKRRFLSGLFR